ncbi:MAG: AbrB/MazE/SpoVT family DNA-binding domain-containing protein [Methanotrichaceae archaeon]|nr:AbrB/MazE/SpoVT family DNA-binding domain-containing protein [Methanotrichaceae archaeon]
MDTRKVQRTGKSTYIVSLPKNWATKNGIQAGSIIYIKQSDNGALLLSTDRSERDLKARLDIGDKSGETLFRDIIGCYLGGYRTIEVTSSRMSSDQKKDLRQIVNKLIGPEILEETISKVVIHDLLSSEELQAQRALKRIKTVVKSMIQDSLSALLNCDKSLAADVIQRDNDVDRLNLLMSRQFTEILRSGSVRQEMLSSITAFNYMLAASNLERVADHAHRIAEIAYQCDCHLDDYFSAELSWLESEFNSLLDDSISFLLQMDSDRANELIEKVGEIQSRTQSLTNLTEIDSESKMLVRLVIASSIERMLDYIMNICELTINLRHATSDIN